MDGIAVQRINASELRYSYERIRLKYFGATRVVGGIKTQYLEGMKDWN